MEPQTKAAGLGLVALELVLAPNYQEPQSFESLELLVVLDLGLPLISDPGAALGLASALDFHLASAGTLCLEAEASRSCSGHQPQFVLQGLDLLVQC